MQPAISSRKWVHQEVEMVRHLVTVQNLSYSAVATRFNTTPAAISGLCRRNNIKHSEEYFKVEKKKKPNTKYLGEEITKECLYCNAEFKSFKALEKKFCSHQHAIDFHNKQNRSDLQTPKRAERMRYLEPPVTARRCICGSVAVPKHLVCYKQGKECYGKSLAR